VATTTTSSELNFDPYDKQTALNPHPLFRRLREEAPLYYNQQHDFYALSRFEDVEFGHMNRETFISGRGVTLDILKANMKIPPGTVIFEDPPTHGIHRALLARMFTPRRVSELEPQIRKFCVNLLDPLVGRGGFDFVADIAKQVPMRVISMLVGIPESDQESVRDYFDDSRKRASDDRDGVLSGSIFADFIDWRAEHPSGDIMTQLMHAEFEDETGTTRRLTREELLAYVNIVAAAGNETTGLLIGWIGRLLADHPDQRRILIGDPSLIANAVDEILRFEPPPLQSCRYVAREVEFYGQTVPEGSSMALLIPSANRDDRRYSDPDRFDVRRESKQLFTFGFGAHYCLGQALARLEGRVVLEEVLKRFPDWEVDEDQAEFAHHDSDLRGWAALPVVTR
jgi:cytochrome P450